MQRLLSKMYLVECYLKGDDDPFKRIQFDTEDEARQYAKQMYETKAYSHIEVLDVWYDPRGYMSTYKSVIDVF